MLILHMESLQHKYNNNNNYIKQQKALILIVIQRNKRTKREMKTKTYCGYVGPQPNVSFRINFIKNHRN